MLGTERTTLERAHLGLLERLAGIQAEEYRQRGELYGDLARLMEDFPGGADSLRSRFDVRVASRGFLQSARAVLDLLAAPGGRAPLTLLDAGCGTGTQSLTFAVLGYRVTGLELDPGFIALARARIGFYKERLQCPIECQFVARDLFREPRTDEYDVVWAREAISHIHPLERFLSYARRALKPRGILVVVDSNWANPLVKAELFRAHWRHYRPFRTWGEASIHYLVERRDPETGETVSMAMERVLTLSRAIRKFREAGFVDVGGEALGFLPKGTLAALCTRDEGRRVRVFDGLVRLEALLGRLPWVKTRGRINVVVGRRE